MATKPIPNRASVSISSFPQGWQASQPWVTEGVRMACCRLFAQSAMQETDGNAQVRLGAHRTAINTQVLKTVGALLEPQQAEISPSFVIDLLLQIEDLAHIGDGIIIPRESRVAVIAPGWARIAGGLPLEHSEHPESGVQAVHANTIGRIAELSKDFRTLDPETEHSEVFRWLSRSSNEIFSELFASLPNVVSSPPPQDRTYYYHARALSARTRRDRWQAKEPDESFTIARTGTQPVHYFLRTTSEQPGARWLDIDHETARKWILLAEKLTGATNRIRATPTSNGITLLLPDMFPNAWTSALLACSSRVSPQENGWTLEISPQVRTLADILFGAANIKLI
jgi:hypothetical protein